MRAALALLALVGWLGCGGAPDQARAVDAAARLANAGGAALAAWSISRAGCSEAMSPEECAHRARLLDEGVWDAWTLFRTAQAAYAAELEAGGAPAPSSVLHAYCAFLGTLPPDAPQALLAGASSCEGP